MQVKVQYSPVPYHCKKPGSEPAPSAEGQSTATRQSRFGGDLCVLFPPSHRPTHPLAHTCVGIMVCVSEHGWLCALSCQEPCCMLGAAAVWAYGAGANALSLLARAGSRPPTFCLGICGQYPVSGWRAARASGNSA